MKIYIITFFISISCLAQTNSIDWPVLKSYNQNHLKKNAMTVGGFGTGTASLKGNGAIQDWEIMNRPAKGFNPWLEKGSPVQRAPFCYL